MMDPRASVSAAASESYPIKNWVFSGPQHAMHSDFAMAGPSTLPLPSGAPAELCLEPLFDFDDLLTSKIVVTEDTVDPLMESNHALAMAMYGHANAHDLAMGSAPTASISDMSLVGLPALPSAHSMEIFKEPFHGLGHSGAPGSSGGLSSLSAFPEPMFPETIHSLADAASTRALGGNSVEDTFASMANAQHDLHGFLSKAVPLTQMVASETQASAYTDVQSLSMSCPLSMDSSVDFSVKTISPDPAQHGLQPLFSTAQLARPPASMVAVVEPVLSKDTVAQTELASVSLGSGHSVLSRHNVSAPRPSAATLPELGLLGRKKNSTQRLYECPTCFKVFDRAYNRKMHMATHEAIEKRLRPFKCPLVECGKQFSRKHDMNRHYLGVHLRARKSSSASVVAFKRTDAPMSSGVTSDEVMTS